MIQLAKVVVHNPNTIIVGTLVVTLGFLAAILIRGITFNGSPETLARKDQTFRFYNETRNIFGDDRIIVVGVTTTDVFTSTFLERLDRLTNRLAAVPGVDQAMSLTNIKAIRREPAGVAVGRLVDTRNLSQAPPAQLDKLKQEVTSDPLYARHY